MEAECHAPGVETTTFVAGVVTFWSYLDATCEEIPDMLDKLWMHHIEIESEHRSPFLGATTANGRGWQHGIHG